MFDPGPCVYMEKLAVGREFAAVVDFEALIEDNLRRIAQAKGSDVTELTVCILDRPRHEEELVGRVRATGARIKLLLDGDVAGAIMAAREETGIDVAVGVGGTPRVSSPPAPPVPGRRHVRPAVAATRGSAGPPWMLDST